MRYGGGHQVEQQIDQEDDSADAGDQSSHKPDPAAHLEDDRGSDDLTQIRHQIGNSNKVHVFVAAKARFEHHRAGVRQETTGENDDDAHGVTVVAHRYGKQDHADAGKKRHRCRRR